MDRKILTFVTRICPKWEEVARENSRMRSSYNF